MHNASALTRPTDLFAPGALDQLFAYNRQVYGGFVMEDPPAGGGSGSGSGAGGTDDPPGGGDGAGSGSGSGAGGAGPVNATDPQGNDLGYPKDTPVAQMDDKQQVAYWRHYARTHEGRLKKLVGDKTPEQIAADLEAYNTLQREQQTPAEQALADAREEGKKEAITSERKKTATAIFRGALESGGLEAADVDELTSNFNVASYVGDDGVDTTKITNFAKRFLPSDTDIKKPRNFGAGQRRESGDKPRGSGGKAEAERRFKKTKSSE